MVLPYRDRTLTIAFTALIFKNQEAVRFRYRLLDLETAWTETEQRSARYTNLPAGDYVFEVESRGENGSWDLQPARAKFVIQTPWYQTWYFFLIFASSVLFGIHLFWRWRLDSLLERQRELEIAVRQRTEAMEELAVRDTLTGLYNRSAIFQMLEKELQGAQKNGNHPTLIMADLDEFKLVNDQFGHEIGDEVLIECATRLRSTVRTSDLIGRYGGEQLAIVLLNCQQPNSLRIAETMRHAICASPFQIGDHTITVTASFGVAAAGKDLTGLQELVRNADCALYQAKHEGRNRVEVWDCLQPSTEPVYRPG